MLTWKSKYVIYGKNWTKCGTNYVIYGFYGLSGHPEEISSCVDFSEDRP